MKKLALSVFPLAVLCLGVFATSASAATVYDNLGVLTPGADSIAAGGPLADSFSTGNSPFALNQVVLLLDGTADSGSVTVQLFADSSANPGALLGTIGTLSDASLTGAPADYAFNLSNPFMLNADTRYWVELSSTDDSSARWAYAADNSGTGVANEYNASTFGVSPIYVSSNSEASPYQMQVDGKVPEPASLADLGIVLVTLAGAFRKKLMA